MNNTCLRWHFHLVLPYPGLSVEARKQPPLRPFKAEANCVHCVPGSYDIGAVPDRRLEKRGATAMLSYTKPGRLGDGVEWSAGRVDRHN